MADPSTRRQPITAKHDAFLYAPIDDLVPPGYAIHGDPAPLDEDKWRRSSMRARGRARCEGQVRRKKKRETRAVWFELSWSSSAVARCVWRPRTTFWLASTPS